MSRTGAGRSADLFVDRPADPAIVGFIHRNHFGVDMSTALEETRQMFDAAATAARDQLAVGDSTDLTRLRAGLRAYDQRHYIDPVAASLVMDAAGLLISSASLWVAVLFGRRDQAREALRLAAASTPASRDRLLEFACEMAAHEPTKAKREAAIHEAFRRATAGESPFDFLERTV